MMRQQKKKQIETNRKLRNLLTRKQAAEYLQNAGLLITEKTLAHWQWKGILKSKRIGRHTYYTYPQLDRLIQCGLVT